MPDAVKKPAASSGGLFLYFANMKISGKIAVGFGFILVLVAALAARTVIQIDRLSGTIATSQDRAKDTKFVGDMEAKFAGLRFGVGEYIKANTPERLRRVEAVIAGIRGNIETARHTIQKPERIKLVGDTLPQDSTSRASRS